jgi:signal transduction histidine kinase
MGEGPFEIAFVCHGDEERARVEADLREYGRARLTALVVDDARAAGERVLRGGARAVLLSCRNALGPAQAIAGVHECAPGAAIVAILPDDGADPLAAVAAGAEDALPLAEVGGGALGFALHLAILRGARRAAGAADAPAGGVRALVPFASVIAHDLHEPLRVVAEYCRLVALRLQGTDDPSVGRYLERIAEAARRMQDHVAGMLEYARAGARPLLRQAVSCDEVLIAALANLKVALDDSGAVVTHDALPTVTADPVQLVQVFQNLIANAIRFRGEASPRVHVRAEPESDGWRFSVRDNGRGFEPGEAQRAFEAFARLPSAGDAPGSGVGLAICKTVVESHGGRIWAEPRPGEGATFHFTLPLER